MKRLWLVRRSGALLLSLVLLSTLSLPVSAFFWNKKASSPTIPDFSKNALVGDTVTFSDQDFSVQNGDGIKLTSITITALPDPGAGTLTLGGQPLAADSVVEASALAGLRFQSLSQPSVTTTSFSFLPTFDDGTQAQQPTTVTLYLLTAANEPPIARNMDLSTYKNVAITGYFDAVDSEGDTLTFQLMDTPARGAVTLAEDGSAKFVYTPYENKTGKDSFTYVAIDSAGNTSSEAKVTIQINKPDTKVTYADMEGDPAHKASIRLAEEGIFVGSYLNGEYFFDPDRPVTRAEFLTMAMATVGMAPLEDVTTTGFTDDAAIPTWAKGAVSAAVMAGVIQGSRDDSGAPVFDASENITQGEATVMLDQLLNLSDVPLEVFSTQGSDAHWAGQAAANLAASGVIRVEETNSAALSTGLDRAQAAMLLDGALDVLSQREEDGWLPW
ncbi:Ig-like domain-containing protein [Flintibacter sp.]|uniref:Ig-like domain-containing protein n=1 Tax=Flintibacter sp. TaxID=1918624 RepID=UPI003D10C83D|nr:S-layer homology domain-containing protein [Flintibacter sp.]